MLRFVSLGALGFFQPGNRLIQQAKLHQVDPDVIVRVAKIGIDTDGPFAVRYCLFPMPQEGYGPAPIGIGLGSRAGLQAIIETVNSGKKRPLPLIAEGQLPRAPGLLPKYYRVVPFERLPQSSCEGNSLSSLNINIPEPADCQQCPRTPRTDASPCQGGSNQAKTKRFPSCRRIILYEPIDGEFCLNRPQGTTGY